MSKELAALLLDTQAVHLKGNEADYFTWTSGIRSPIYCDNRKLISYPKYRKMVVNAFVSHIKQNYPHTNVIAGTATAGIPWASWIAEAMDLPMLYVRSSNKSHGLQNSIEGNTVAGANVIVIEDLFSTGKSSIQAARDLAAAQQNVLAVVAIFSYGLKKAQIAFEEAKFSFHSLTSFEELLEVAKEREQINLDQAQNILDWRKKL